MVDFTQKIPQIGFTPTAFVDPGRDTTGAQLAGLAQNIGKVITDSNKSKAEAEALNVLNSFEDDLIDQTDQVVGFNQQVASTDVSEGDPLLTPEDNQALTRIRQESSRLKDLEAAGQSSTKVDLSRISAYRKFKRQYPHLTPELRELFKKQTGKAVLETLKEVEEEAAKDAQSQLKEEKDFYLQFAQKNNMFNPNESHEQRVQRMEPLMRELRMLDESKRKLESLQTKREIGHEQRRVAQEGLIREGFSGYVVATNVGIQDLFTQTGFDPENTPPKDRGVILQQLNNRFVATQSELLEVSSDVPSELITPRLNVIKQQYEQAQAYINGEVTKEQYENSVNIYQAAASHRLLELPGVADKLAVMKEFKGLDGNLLLPEQKLQFGNLVVLPLAQGMLTSIDNPQRNAYDALAVVADTPQQVKYYEDLTKILGQNLDNEVVADKVSNILESYSNAFDIDPQAVPTGVYDKMLELSADPKWKNVVNKGLNLSDNFVSGMQEYTNRVQRVMANDMAKTLGSGISIQGLNRTEFKDSVSGFLGINIEAKRPRIFELMNIIPNSDGSVSFSPVSKYAANPQLRKEARNLNKKYSSEIRKLARSYAHTVQRNEDYVEALQKILSGSAFEPVNTLEPSGTVEGGVE